MVLEQRTSEIQDKLSDPYQYPEALGAGAVEADSFRAVRNSFFG